MTNEQTLTQAHLKTPRSAAIAGIVFSALIMTSLLLFRQSIPADPLDRGGWLERDPHRVVLALNLIPFAGIAFLWFVGVLRDRLGAREDRFFATVFLGSGILFLGLLFVAAAIIGAIGAHGPTRRPARVARTPDRPQPDLQSGKHLRDQDGGRFHDLYIQACIANRVCCVLDGGVGLCSGGYAAFRQLLDSLELPGLSALGFAMSLHVLTDNFRQPPSD